MQEQFEPCMSSKPDCLRLSCCGEARCSTRHRTFCHRHRCCSRTLPPPKTLYSCRSRRRKSTRCRSSSRSIHLRCGRGPTSWRGPPTPWSSRPPTPWRGGATRRRGPPPKRARGGSASWFSSSSSSCSCSSGSRGLRLLSGVVREVCAKTDCFGSTPVPASTDALMPFFQLNQGMGEPFMGCSSPTVASRNRAFGAPNRALSLSLRVLHFERWSEVARNAFSFDINSESGYGNL